MFITKKHIPRRTFLRGVGVTLALPLLDSMLPAQTPVSRTAANPKGRFMGIFVPHGWAPGYWIPATEGSNFEFPYVTKPLEAFRDRVTILNGLDSTSSMSPPGSSGGDHSRGSAFLTGVNPKKTAGSDIYGGISIDQMIANEAGQDTLVPSVQIGIEDPGAQIGVCGWGYSCVYTNTVSWAAPTKPLPMELQPQVIFERLFGDGSNPEARKARRQEDSTILDSVTRGMARLRTKLPSPDRSRLDEYLNDIREIERRLKLAATASQNSPSIDVPFGVPQSFEEQLNIMFDLVTIGYRGDITRVATMMMGRDTSDRTFPECGFDGSWHDSSHHGEDPKRCADYAKINRYHQQALTYFLKKLQATPDGDGTLLDHSVLLWGSTLGNANVHGHVNVGHMLVGGAGGLKGNRHIKSAAGTPTSNLLLSTLDLFGIHKDSVGDSTGRVSL